MLTKYIQSKQNVFLLQDFAFRTLSNNWKKQDALKNAIDLHLHDCIVESLDNHSTLDLTGHNIATVNVAIWKLLKLKVIKALEGMPLDPQELVQNTIQFKNENIASFETKSDFVIPERDFTEINQEFLNSWYTK
jgi:hypothetical protein